MSCAYMYVCVCVHVHMCYECLYVCAYILHMNVCMCMCMHVYVYACVLRMYLCAYVLHMCCACVCAHTIFSRIVYICTILVRRQTLHELFKGADYFFHHSVIFFGYTQ